MYTNRFLFSFVVLLCAFGNNAFSVSEIHVYQGESIQNAIDNVDAGGTVIVHPGTYNQTINFGGKNIVVKSYSDDPSDTIIDPNFNESNPSDVAVVEFDGTETSACQLRGLTITGGYNCTEINTITHQKIGNGGGINGNNAYVAVINCIITGNYAAESGGGICRVQGNIVDCIIRENSVGHYWLNWPGYVTEGVGGGMAYHSSKAVISSSGVIQNCVIENNVAMCNGGGIFECFEAENCDILNNTAQYGGGAYAGSFTNCLIQGNRVLGEILFSEEDPYHPISYPSGGGLFGGDANDCTVIDNESEGCGGGIYGGSIKNCLIENNSAVLFGGGLLGGVSIDSQIYNNTAQWGGGIFMGTSQNCHIKGNVADYGGGASSEAHILDTGVKIELIGCLIEDNSALVGGGVYVFRNGEIYNCTIVRNENYGIYLEGYWDDSSYPPVFDPAKIVCINTILWGNHNSNSIITEIAGDLSDIENVIEYNCISKFYGHNPGTIDDKHNIVGIYPGFVDPGAGNYHIMPYTSNGSYWPPIDYGTTELTKLSYLNRDYLGRIDYENNKDMDGKQRVRQVYGPNEIDMGAYEYDPNDPNIPDDPNIPTESDYRHYTFDQESGLTAYDYGLVNHYNGQLVNGPVWEPNDGIFDGALQFDGSDDYVVISNYKGIAGGASRSCSAWIKVDSTGNIQEIMNWGTLSGGQSWQMGLDASGQLVVGVASSPNLTGSTILTDGRWHHVAAVLNNDGSPTLDEVKLYVDGEEETPTTSNTTTIATASGADAQIGSIYYGGQTAFFKGMMDDVQIHQDVWTAQMIEDYYQSARSTQLRDEAVVYYTCDESTGTTLNDSGETPQQNATLTGVSWSTSGAMGSALSFIGTNNYATITNYKGITGGASRTCSAWIKASSPGTGNVQEIMNWGTLPGNGTSWQIGLDSSGRLVVGVGSSPNLTGTTSLTDNQWHHVVAVLNNDGSPELNDVVLYVDGAVVTTTPGASTTIATASGADVQLGSIYYYGQVAFFKGLMDEVRIYDQALPVSDVQILYGER